jgi:hypothetical protein
MEKGMRELLKNRTTIANTLFYIALAIETILMIVDKSELNVPFESHVFRVTFLLTLLAVAITSHNQREWAIIAATIVFTFICYRISGKNELLRFSVFVMAARDIKLDKTMKAYFYIMAAGFGLIALLSVTGIMGQIKNIADYGREAGEEIRYVFGFGHPNSLWGCVFALGMVWLWIYGKNAKLWHYLIYGLIQIVLYKLTVSRTAFIIGLFSLVLALAARYIPALAEKKIPYMLSVLVTPVFCVAFSVWGSIVSPVPRYEFEHKHYGIINKVDKLLNQRIHNLYRANNRHAGYIGTWKLFSDRISDEYFDMGWVRLFYWYGIIPTVIISLLVILLIYLCYRKKDIYTLVIVLSLSIYTIVEATFVSVYIGRNFMLPILGVYLGEYLRTTNARKRDVANR